MLDLDKKKITTLLKIDNPFLFIDKVVNIIPGDSGVGIKNIYEDEWFYKSHFTDQGIMPGSLQLEAMLQTTVSIIYSAENLNIEKSLITKTSTNFYSKVNGAGELKIDSKIIENNRGIIKAKAITYFKKIKVSDGIFTYIIPSIFKI